MTIPAPLADRLAGLLGAPVAEARPVYGGDINQAARVTVGRTSYFVKWNASAPSEMFPTEAHGLRLLASADALRVPDVIAQGTADAAGPAFLVLEWIESGRRGREQAMAGFGEGLAALHRQTSDAYGLECDNFIGPLSQPNAQSAHWADFYRDHRIGWQTTLARQRGRLPKRREDLLTRLMERLPALLAGAGAEPSLLHGDLWGGNYLVDERGAAVLIDPAAYYGHREMDLAMSELFGGFSGQFYTAYETTYPTEGYHDRRALYQLYYLLVHLNLFGESYGGRVDSIAAHYVGW